MRRRLDVGVMRDLASPIGEIRNEARLLSVGLGNLAYELRPGHVHGTVDRAGLRSRIRARRPFTVASPG